MNLDQNKKFELFNQFLDEIEDDKQYEKALSSLDQCLNVSAIETFFGLLTKHPKNLLLLAGIFEALINIRDFIKANLFFFHMLKTINPDHLFFFLKLKKKLEELENIHEPNPYLTYYGRYPGKYIEEYKNVTLRLHDCDSDFSKIFILMDYVPMNGKLTKDGQIEIKETINKDEYYDGDLFTGSGIITSSGEVKIVFNQENIKPLKYTFEGKKEGDYFHCSKNKFIVLPDRL